MFILDYKQKQRALASRMWVPTVGSAKVSTDVFLGV